MVMNDLEGVVEVKDQTLWLQKMTMSSLGGTTSLKGYYRYNGTGNPHMEMDFSLEEVSVNKAAVAFSAMSKYAPIAKKANGAITTSFDIKTDLDNNLNPLFETMNGKGALQANSLSIGNVNTLNQLGDALKINELKQAVIKNIQLDFSIQQGSLFVQPFDMSLNGMKAALGGRTGLDQSIDYNLKLDIPRKKLGSDANELLENLAGKVQATGCWIMNWEKSST
ncbi:MAG: AsmA-like C-terminal region-containing protein [Bacteroidales bacterium]|nr:AsmA-like C-terminal region-containing protein [Bacteroidales bacterium]